jgi:hypothetical protein
MKEIPLTRGYVAIVDDEDFEALSQHKWCALVLPRKVYAMRGIGGRKNRKYLFMHRVIVGANPSVKVDHENHDGLDNRRCNIRIATHGQNQQNQRKQKRATSSSFKGVTWCKNEDKWKAQIQHNHKHIHLGYFDKEHEAATCYNAAAVQRFGEFASLNVIQ